MTNLKSRNVFIDTEVFEGSNFDFHSRHLSEIVRLAQKDLIRVFLTTITVGEIRAHIAEKINAAAAKLKKFRIEEGRILQNLPNYELLLEKMDKQKCIAHIEDQFNEFLTGSKATVIDARAVNAEEVFRDYFKLRPPFGEGRKKEEFPDAFAQYALSNWCEQNSCDMYAVSANHDWHTPKNHLIPLAKLQEFLDAAIKDEAGEALHAQVLGLYEKHFDKVERAIKDAFRNSEFYASDVDGDVEDVTIKRIKIEEPFVVEVDDTSATISVDVDIDYVADVSYLNDDEGIWDGEDHVWSYRPTAYVDTEESERFEAELEVTYDLAEEHSFEVSCTIDKTFKVTALPTDYELK
jgi:hypothetical protein